MNNGWITKCTYEKYDCIYEKVKKMKIREKRNFFAVMRRDDTNFNWFLPAYGLTAGIFSFFHVLNECPRRRAHNKKQPSQTESSTTTNEVTKPPVPKRSTAAVKKIVREKTTTAARKRKRKDEESSESESDIFSSSDDSDDDSDSYDDDDNSDDSNFDSDTDERARYTVRKRPIKMKTVTRKR